MAELLKDKKCVPCKKGTLPLSDQRILMLLEQLAPGWIALNRTMIKKTYPFENFKNGMAFLQEIAHLADVENHHPDLCVSHVSVYVELTTHDIGGLSLNDFILAAKIDAL